MGGLVGLVGGWVSTLFLRHARGYQDPGPGGKGAHAVESHDHGDVAEVDAWIGGWVVG